MLDNEFDQIFRDRLLDHSSNVPQGLWKHLHTHLVRHTAMLKWYFVGPSAVAVAVTGYFLVTAIRSSAPAKHPSPAAAVATYNTRPNPDSSATAGATPAGTSPAGSSATAGATPAGSPANSAAPANSATTAGSAANNPAASGVPSNSANGPAAISSTPPTPLTHVFVSTHSSTAHRTRRHSGNSAGIHPGHRPETGSDDAALAADAGSTRSGTANTADLSATSPATTHSPIPAELTAPAKLAALKTRPDIAAATTSPKKPQQLTLPAHRSRNLPSMRVDAFASPEYFTAHIFGFSYGAGARVTVVYKKHFTFTTGVQYLRVAVKGTNDSTGFPSGYIKDLHLPLLLGYTTGDDRFTFSANAGVLLSLYAHSGGEMTYTGLWSNRDGPSAYLDLDFASHVTSRVSVFAEPYVKSWYYQPRHQFLPFNPSSLPFPAWSVGLMVGLRYNFKEQ